MTLPLPYVARDPDAQANFDQIAMAFPVSSANAAYANVTALPTTGQNGQVVYYTADATNGVVWAFKYRSASASASKWEFVGGPPLLAEVVTAQTTASTTYAALATAGPSITLPLAGDYDVAQGANYSSNVAPESGLMSYDIGGTGAVDADAVESSVSTASRATSMTRTRRKTGLTAVTLTSKYRVGGNTGTFQKRWISVLPVRVT